ncbi:hypothetical protein K450DRAFT_259301 [Umbelopsis ramanniana AG]|uniref:Uncharacterized protein n=1 Tax=Umbelopsis ramanniana AG TaxID=1314678 RepID=A0AAD5E361_UMBRA|nr:uncharacterized protein K450DRAFT_259301 [Umbelopsis ramanniana AG]KAI8575899.1 hypothetical protein K450DRAFT_259301 [Umbelopsis ramanniana AG]
MMSTFYYSSGYRKVIVLYLVAVIAVIIVVCITIVVIIVITDNLNVLDFGLHSSGRF